MLPFQGLGPSPGTRATLIDLGARLFMTGTDSLDVLASLEVGDALAGRVVKILQDSRILMRFQGRELVATSTLPLEEGEGVRGIVQSKGPPLILKIVREDLSEKVRILIRFRSLAAQLLPSTKDHPAVALLRSHGVEENNWTEPVARWLKGFALGEAASIEPERVRAVLIHGGMFYERMVWQWATSGGHGKPFEPETDLKGVALRLLGQAGGHGEKVGILSERAAKSLESLIGKIELFQTANWLSRQEGFGFIFQIPLLFGNEPRTADLLVDFPQKKGGKKDGLRILLLLNLGGLGRFQIEASISKRGVAATIGVDREETVALVRSMIEELKKGLENQKLTVEGIECVHMQKAMAREDLFQHLLAMDETEGVDIRV